MNHPPIPPNSEFFSEMLLNGKKITAFRLYVDENPKEYVGFKISKRSPHRRLIADHASGCWERMAWEYEWEQNVEDWEHLAADARENAVAWDDWGDQ